MRIPVLDDHIHLSPAGGNVESVKRFERAGGTHCIIVNMPYAGMEALKNRCFIPQYEETIRLCKKVNLETGVKAFAVVGPYPVELLSLAEKYGLEKAKEIMLKGIDDAAGFIKERNAIGFGEIGRPHFEVSKDILEASNEVMEYAFKTAKSLDCAVVLHTERAKKQVYAEIVAIASNSGIDKRKVVKHFASVETISDSRGITPSVLASREILKPELYEKPNFMLETDFLDDFKRPGAVLDITTVPKRVRQLIEMGIGEEKILEIMKDLPEKVYGIEISVNAPNAPLVTQYRNE
ncbi:MAG: TatD family hydrolase [Thermoplasmata archaeon]